MKIIIEKHDSSTPLLAFLRERLGLSQAHIRHLKYIENGITVNSSHVTVRYILREGDVLELASEDTEPSENIIPSALELDVLYEDENIVVPNKPHGMPTHPSHNHYDDTVANALAYRYQALRIPFVFRPVNRLDKDTSGLLIIARDRISASRLFEQMRRGEIVKEYIAILDGVPPETNGKIEAYIRRKSESIITRETCEKCENADYAFTKYTILATNGKYSVVRATPITGRTHQLRVHFAHIGCPIVGDDLYGTSSPYITRHALHAERLIFTHPMTKGMLDIRSPLPIDMQKLVDILFERNGTENKNSIS